ncbi:unnamed protein product, partial [Staurois parvus]
PAAAPPAEAAAKKKPAKKTAAGPGVSELLVQAVSASKERRGVSLAALKKVLSTGGYDVDKNKSRLKIALLALVTKGSLVQVKGHGASGSFKINKKQPEGPKDKAKPKKPAAKKATKSPKKKAARKTTTAVKSPKKAAKSLKKAAASKTTTAAKSPKKLAAKRPAKAAAKRLPRAPRRSKLQPSRKPQLRRWLSPRKPLRRRNNGRRPPSPPPKALLRAPHLLPTELSIHTPALLSAHTALHVIFPRYRRFDRNKD